MVIPLFHRCRQRYQQNTQREEVFSFQSFCRILYFTFFKINLHCGFEKPTPNGTGDVLREEICNFPLKKVVCMFHELVQTQQEQNSTPINSYNPFSFSNIFKTQNEKIRPFLSKYFSNKMIASQVRSWKRKIVQQTEKTKLGQITLATEPAYMTTNFGSDDIEIIRETIEETILHTVNHFLLNFNKTLSTLRI